MYPRFKYISNIKSPQGPWDGLHAPKLNSARPGLANTAPADVPDIEPARLGLACSKTPHLPTFPTSSPLGSTWPARKHRTCRRFRHGACSAQPGVLEITAPADVSDIEPARLGLACSKTPHLPTFPTSSPLGSAGALEMAARARSALLGRSKWPFEVARLRQGGRNCPAWLLENIAPVDVSSFEPARLRWGARHSRSSPLGPAGAPEIAARARSAPLLRRRFTGQDHECLLHSTQRRTFSCMECTGTH